MSINALDKKWLTKDAVQSILVGEFGRPVSDYVATGMSSQAGNGVPIPKKVGNMATVLGIWYEDASHEQLVLAARKLIAAHQVL